MNNNIKDQLGLNFSFPPTVLDSLAESVTYQSCVKMMDNFENACLDLIKEACKESGINNLVLLNKKAIVEAFRKQMPKEPLSQFPISFCPCCSRVVYPQMKYCCDCGQKFDWGKEVQSDE